MILSYKYRLYPTKSQARALTDILGVACALYNHALAHRRERWAESRVTVRLYDEQHLLSQWRNEDPDHNPLRLLPLHAGRLVLKRLDTAYQEAIKGARGFPRFRKRDRFDTVIYEYGSGAHLRADRLDLWYAGAIPVRWHRPLPDKADIKTVTITRRASGWYACFQIQVSDPGPAPHPGPAVGVDMGLYHALALSDGTIIDSQRQLGQSLRCLRLLQRHIARCQRGSNRRKKAIKQLARLHERIANQRADWWHKVTRWLVNTYGAVILEDLNLSFMLRNGKQARAAHDVGLGMFRSQLAYKAAMTGTAVLTVNPAYTSQACALCGCIVPKELNQRVHQCPECGFTADRDVNAALNILSRAGHARQTLT